MAPTPDSVAFLVADVARPLRGAFQRRLDRLIDQLAACGAVERHEDPSDARAYRLHLGAAAAPHLESINAVIAQGR